MKELAITVALLDVAVVYLLLNGATKVYGGKCHHVRALIASVISGICSAIVLSGAAIYIDNYSTRMVILVVAGVITYGCNKDCIGKTALFLLLNAALEGIVNTHPRIPILHRFSVTITIVSLCYVLHTPRRAKASYAHIKIGYRGKTVCVDAFRDTGNRLQDIVTGLPVLVIGPEAAYQLTGLIQEELSSPLETIEKRILTGIRLIPFSSVGNSHGFMLGVRSRDIVVDGIPTDMVIAMAPEGMGIYEALIGGDHDTWDHQNAVKKVRTRRNIAPLHRRNRYTSFTIKGEG